MKKKAKAIVLLLTLLLIVSGCTNKDYGSNMELGKEQLNGNHYLEAYEAFTSANQDQNTAESKELMDLSKLLADGTSQFEQGKYAVALRSFKKAAGFEGRTKEGKDLVKRADKWVTKVVHIQNGVTSNDGGQQNTDIPTIPKKQVSGSESTTEEPSNSDTVVSKNHATKGNKTLTVKEAEKLVKDFINIENYPQLRVEYDHKENGDYIFQVFESVEDGQGGHTATWGWYRVNPNTKKVLNMM